MSRKSEAGAQILSVVVEVLLHLRGHRTFDPPSELRVADPVAGSGPDQEVRLADALARLAVELDLDVHKGPQMSLVDRLCSLGKEAERFAFALPPIVDWREVDDVRRGGQGGEIPRFVQPAEPAERLFEGGSEALRRRPAREGRPGGPPRIWTAGGSRRRRSRRSASVRGERRPQVRKSRAIMPHSKRRNATDKNSVT